MLINPQGYMIYYHNYREFIPMKIIKKIDYEIIINKMKDVIFINNYFIR